MKSFVRVSVVWIRLGCTDCGMNTKRSFNLISSSFHLWANRLLFRRGNESLCAFDAVSRSSASLFLFWVVDFVANPPPGVTFVFAAVSYIIAALSRHVTPLSCPAALPSLCCRRRRLVGVAKPRGGAFSVVDTRPEHAEEALGQSFQPVRQRAHE